MIKYIFTENSGLDWYLVEAREMGRIILTFNGRKYQVSQVGNPNNSYNKRLSLLYKHYKYNLHLSLGADCFEPIWKYCCDADNEDDAEEKILMEVAEDYANFETARDFWTHIKHDELIVCGPIVNDKQLKEFKRTLLMAGQVCQR